MLRNLLSFELLNLFGARFSIGLLSSVSLELGTRSLSFPRYSSGVVGSLFFLPSKPRRPIP